MTLQDTEFSEMQLRSPSPIGLENDLFKSKKPAIFLDRDGTIIKNRKDYVLSIADVVFIDKALEALKYISKLPYRKIIISNQSCVGRGLISAQDFDLIHSFVIDAIETFGGKIDGTVYCFHTPEDRCLCRKPKPGLITYCQRWYDVDTSKSWFLGDALEDIGAALVAGCYPALVKTGRGNHALRTAPDFLKPFLKRISFKNLHDAVTKLWPNAHTDSPDIAPSASTTSEAEEDTQK